MSETGGNAKKRNHHEEQKQAYENGATRSVLMERFDLIPFAGIEAAARRFALGASKHGERNWEGGDKAFALATLNHLLRHAAQFGQAHEQEDLDAIVCNAMMLCEFRRKGMF